MSPAARTIAADPPPGHAMSLPAAIVHDPQ